MQVLLSCTLSYSLHSLVFISLFYFMQYDYIHFSLSLSLVLRSQRGLHITEAHMVILTLRGLLSSLMEAVILRVTTIIILNSSQSQHAITPHQ